MSIIASPALDLTTLTGDYSLDAAHSRVGFQARHAMVTKVRGAFNDVTGTIHLDGGDPSRSNAQVTVQAASVDTRNADRDAHLIGGDFLAIDQYPTITFASTAAERIDSENSLLTGDLSIRGVSRPVVIPFAFSGTAVDPWGNTRVGFEGSVVINRKDWGITFNAALDAGGVLLGEKVTLEFDLSLVKVA